MMKRTRKNYNDDDENSAKRTKSKAHSHKLKRKITDDEKNDESDDVSIKQKRPKTKKTSKKKKTTNKKKLKQKNEDVSTVEDEEDVDSAPTVQSKPKKYISDIHDNEDEDGENSDDSVQIINFISNNDRKKKQKTNYDDPKDQDVCFHTLQRDFEPEWLKIVDRNNKPNVFLLRNWLQRKNIQVIQGEGSILENCKRMLQFVSNN